MKKLFIALPVALFLAIAVSVGVFFLFHKNWTTTLLTFVSVGIVYLLYFCYLNRIPILKLKGGSS